MVSSQLLTSTMSCRAVLSRAASCPAVLCRVVQGEIGGANSVLSAMLNEVSPSTGDYVRIGNIYGQVMNLMIAGERVQRV